MTLVEKAIQDKFLRKQILIKFGLGTVHQKKIEIWLKETYPVKFTELKRNVKKSTNNSKVIQLSIDLTTTEEKNAIRDYFLSLINENHDVSEN